MRLRNRCGRTRQTEGYAREPGYGFLRHWPAQLAQRHVSRRIAAHEIDRTPGVRIVAFLLWLGDREHDIAMGIIDRQHAGRADDTYFRLYTAPGQVTGRAHEILR